MEEQKITFIKISRTMLNWEWYDDETVVRVFLHLLLTANYLPSRWHGVDLKPGELITSYGNLSKRLKLSVKQIRTALDKLKRTGEVAIKTTNKFSVITIVNWDKYQSKPNQNSSKRASQWAPKGQTEGKQGAIKGQQIKNIKEREERKNIDTLTRGLTPAGEYEDKPWCGTNERVF